MFRFRAKRKDNGEWVEGYLTQVGVKHELAIKRDGNVYFIEPKTLSISTGKLDSKGEEIFASFEVDGVMTTGGDVVNVPRWKHLGDMPVSYSPLWSRFLVGSFELSNADSNEITIIGKQGGGDE